MNILRRLYLDIKEIPRLLRSYLFCFKYLPYNQAIKLPIYLHNPIKVSRLKRGNIVFACEIKRRQFQFGEGIAGYPAPKTNIYIEEGGKIIVYGKVFIGKGCTLRVDRGGLLELGDGFGLNKNVVIRCAEHITMKENVIIGWHSEVNDHDGHPIYVDGIKVKTPDPIIIGPNVWVTTHVKINKGVVIPDGCIVAKGAVVVKKHIVPHTLIGGVPAKDIKHGVTWSKF